MGYLRFLCQGKGLEEHLPPSHSVVTHRPSTLQTEEGDGGRVYPGSAQGIGLTWTESKVETFCSADGEVRVPDTRPGTGLP